MMSTRRHKRYKIDVIEINGKMLLAKYVRILDISLGGISIQTEKRMNIGSEYILKIESKGKILPVKGKVVWSFLGESISDTKGNIIPLYTAGMQFTDISEITIQEIALFIEVHKQTIDKQVDLFKPNGRRLFIRIHIADPEKAIMHFQENYKVRKISLGGMLIESEHALDIESKLPMEMNLPEDKSIHFSGRVVSCLLIENEVLVHYDIGIDFLDMSEQDRVTLKAFLSLLNNKDRDSSPQ